MVFSFGFAGTKQMKTNGNKPFSTKTKQMSFSFGFAGTKQIKTNIFLPFSTKTKQNKCKNFRNKWTLVTVYSFIYTVNTLSIPLNSSVAVGINKVKADGVNPSELVN